MHRIYSNENAIDFFSRIEKKDWKPETEIGTSRYGTRCNKEHLKDEVKSEVKVEQTLI